MVLAQELSQSLFLEEKKKRSRRCGSLKVDFDQLMRAFVKNATHPESGKPTRVVSIMSHHQVKPLRTEVLETTTTRQDGSLN